MKLTKNQKYIVGTIGAIIGLYIFFAVKIINGDTIYNWLKGQSAQ